MQITVFPTVFVALGGTGQTILHQFRRGLRQRIGTADLPFFRYLYIDTDESSLKEADNGLSAVAREWTKTNRIDPSPDTIKRIRNPDLDDGKLYRSLGLEDWFPPYVNDTLGQTNYSQGVGGRRVLSRLGFLSSRNLGALEQTLSKFYDELHGIGKKMDGKRLEGIEPSHLEIRSYSSMEKVRFVVLTSAGGGTGSGTFIDFGFFLRRLAERKSAGNKIDLIGHVLLARVEANLNQVRNSAAILTELDVYQVDERRVYEGHYMNLPGSPWVNQSGHKPYDCTYVLMPQQQLKVLEGGDPFLALQHKVADYLICDTVATFADNVSEEHVKNPRFGPVGVEAFKGDFGLNVKGIQTYGVARREWPAALIHRQLYSRKLESVSEKWSEIQESTQDKLLSDLRKLTGLPATPETKPPHDHKEDAIFVELCKTVDQNSPKTLINRVREKALDSRGTSLRPGGLKEMVGELRALFADQKKSDTRSVVGVVTANTKRLKDRKSSDGLAQKAASLMLSELFTTNGGPATVLSCCRQLRDEIKEEQKVIGEALEGIEPRLPDDPLMLKQGYRFANDSLLKLTLSSKRELLADLEEWLEALEVRFHHLLEYVIAWKGSISYDESDLDDRSVVVPEAFVDKLLDQLPVDLDFERAVRVSSSPGSDLRKELSKLVEDGLPKTNKKGEPTLFASDLPRREGSVDFRYFQAIESTVFTEVERLESGPHHQEVFAAMVECAKESGGNAVPNLMEEAEFLIHADTGAQDYITSSFSGNPTHISYIYQTDQRETEMFETAIRDGSDWLDQWRTLGGIKECYVGREVTRKLTPHSAAIICERCALPTRFIVGYDLERRAQQFDRDPFPAVTDKRIVIPPSERLMVRAEKLLVGSMAFQFWIYEGGRDKMHRLEYKSTREGGSIENREYKIPSKFYDAVETLARREDVMNALDERLARYLKNNGGEGVERMVKLLDNLHELNRDRGTTKGPLENYHLIDVPYAKVRNTAYEFADEFEMMLPREQHPFAEFVAKGETIKASKQVADHDGWFCKECGYRQGTEMPEWVGADARCQRESCGYPRRTAYSGGRS